MGGAIVRDEEHAALGAIRFLSHNLRAAPDEAMRFDGPALVNVKLTQGSERKALEFRWHG